MLRNLPLETNMAGVGERELPEWCKSLVHGPAARRAVQPLKIAATLQAMVRSMAKRVGFRVEEPYRTWWAAVTANRFHKDTCRLIMVVNEIT